MRKSMGWALPMGVLAATLVAGCRVEQSGRDGDDKDVKVATPFGGMQVKTNDAVSVSDIGLPLYPGATEIKNDKDGGAADVNMSFGSFQMRVKAASYRTGDPTSKVEAFYRDGLRHFGDVIACREGRPVGSPAQTSEGLACDTKNGNRISLDENSGKGKLELKAGSKQHQHIVAVEPEGSGTKFALVALDLPGKLFADDHEGDRQ